MLETCTKTVPLDKYTVIFHHQSIPTAICSSKLTTIMVFAIRQQWLHVLAASTRRHARRICGETDRGRPSTVDLAVFWDTVSVSLPPLHIARRALCNLRSHGRMVERRIYLVRHRSSGSLGNHCAIEDSGFSLSYCREDTGSVARRLSVDLLHFAWCRTAAEGTSGRAAAVVLVTDDSDYAYLLHKVRDLGVKTIVLHPGVRQGVPKSLVDAADVLLELGSKVEELERGTAWPVAGQDPYMEYGRKMTHGRILSDYKAFDASSRDINDIVIVDEHQSGNQSDLVVGLDEKLWIWEDLSCHARLAAEVLGYDKNSWTNGETPPQSTKEWALLSTEEQMAALQLGYSPAEWDHELAALGILPPRIEGVAQAQSCVGSASQPASGVDAFAEAFAEDIKLGLLAPSTVDDDDDDAFSEDVRLGLVKNSPKKKKRTGKPKS
eukprot:TRINITY_DN61652_c0_g1_i1.p1 TRINITY_DN61652_c0_g1~~TRINITY_DN61652_c0_g1_i1.p1  ORF type:complete len:436 (+),score=62.84 TRINITY_DN61652_c0_g1_i1:203-1510(+)